MPIRNLKRVAFTGLMPDKAANSQAKSKVHM
jgi:hypothetical protein